MLRRLRSQHMSAKTDLKASHQESPGRGRVSFCPRTSERSGKKQEAALQPGERREKSPRREPDVRLQLHQQQPTLSCSAAPRCSSSRAQGGQSQEPWQPMSLGQATGGGSWPQVSPSKPCHHLQSGYAATPGGMSTCWLPREAALSPMDLFF